MLPGPTDSRGRTPAGAGLPRGARSPGILLLRLVTRTPRGVREPILRPFSALAAAATRRRNGHPLGTTLPLIVDIGAGQRDRAAAMVTRVGLSPRTSQGARERALELAAAAGLHAALAAIAEARPDDHSRGLEMARASVALEAGRYSAALEHARAASGSALAPRLAAIAAGHLALLAPGWLPDPGPASAVLQASRRDRAPGRVLHVVSSSLPFSQAGYNVRTAAVTACQRQVGLEPHVAVRTGYRAAVSKGGSPRRVLDSIAVNWLGPPTAGSPSPDRLQNDSIRLLAALAAEVRPAVLQPASDYLQAQLALALREPLGIPVVYEVRGFWEETWASRHPGGETVAVASERYRLTREAETAAMLSADAVVTLSEVMRQEIIGRGCDPDCVVIIPNAVDAERYVPQARDAQLAERLGIGREDPVVGYVSSLNSYEGIRYLVEAAARLRDQVPNLRVLVVGEGPDGDAIRETAHRLGLDGSTLIMPGRVPHDAIVDYYSLIDVFVVPRTSQRVSQLVTPLKPYEAMALERAVVVSDLPALREIVIPGETGLTFRPEDAQDLAEVLGMLLDDPMRRARLGRQAREWVLAERTWASNGRRYRDLFERLGVA